MSDRIHVATRKGLFTLSRGAQGYAIERVSFLGDNVNLVLSEGDTVWAALALGHYGPKLRKSTDGGVTFVDVATPALPPQEPAAGKKALATSMIWSLERRGGRLWCGTVPGGVHVSDDEGASWQLSQALWDDPARAEWFGGGTDDPGVHSIVLDPRHDKRLTIGVSCGGVWRSEDDGASWRVVGDGLYAAFMPPERRFDPRIQDPHRLAFCAAAPDVVWAQHHNGVFKSDDGGLTFRSLEHVPPSTFGFAVAAHPKDPGTAWFVPATKDELRVPVDGKLVVARTKDGGATFEVLTRGLPQCPSYDLVWRHALDVDATGDRLAFGSTTGGLWTSDDGGDSFTALDARLPPIAAVRFAS
jgi:hypothetical protein